MNFYIESFKISPSPNEPDEALPNGTPITMITEVVILSGDAPGSLIFEYYFGGTLKTSSEMSVDESPSTLTNSATADINLVESTGTISLSVEVRVRAVGDPNQETARRRTWAKA